VKLRLTRGGQKKRPFYRIIAANVESRRDGRFLEIIGTYNPMADPAEVNIKEELVKKWIAVGAKPTRVVQSLLRKHLPDTYEVKLAAQKEKIKADRNKRRERQKASETPKAEKKQKRGRKSLLKKKVAA
ncbi:UNVERIFIED_CONTAM: hypothetical protein GTU68_028181, partial [Idotea baltica]|nr:hypothetical protein [Idotea baltica]